MICCSSSKKKQVCQGVTVTSALINKLYSALDSFLSCFPFFCCRGHQFQGQKSGLCISKESVSKGKDTVCTLRKDANMAQIAWKLQSTRILNFVKAWFPEMRSIDIESVTPIHCRKMANKTRREVHQSGSFVTFLICAALLKKKECL